LGAALAPTPRLVCASNEAVTPVSLLLVLLLFMQASFRQASAALGPACVLKSNPRQGPCLALAQLLLLLLSVCFPLLCAPYLTCYCCCCCCLPVPCFSCSRYPGRVEKNWAPRVH
jgi:hypothetical protein